MFRKNPKRIFAYFDGYKKRFGDPMVILNAIDGHPKYNPDKHPKLSKSSDRKVSVEAYRICIECFKEAFDLPAYDDKTGEGLTLHEVIQLNDSFCVYCDSLKKNTKDSSTQLESSESTS